MILILSFVHQAEEQLQADLAEAVDEAEIDEDLEASFTSVELVRLSVEDPVEELVEGADVKSAALHQLPTLNLSFSVHSDWSPP